MNTVTLPKSKFNILQKRASLYEAILRFLPERKWGIEEYSPQRIREFMREDKISQKPRSRVRKILSSRA